MANLPAVTDQNFNQTITAGKPAVIDFWAVWCGPCKVLSPLIEELSREYEGKAIFGAVNVDEQPMLSQRFGVMSIPTVVYFKDGKVVDQTIGALPKEEIKKHIEKLLH